MNIYLRSCLTIGLASLFCFQSLETMPLSAMAAEINSLVPETTTSAAASPTLETTQPATKAPPAAPAANAPAPGTSPRTPDIDLLKRAAGRGNAEAAFNLGVYYQNGHGVAQDLTEAVSWYSKAAESGFAPAQFNLGVCYDQGRGVVKNPEKAVHWYTMAAEQEYAGAQYNLALCYAAGQGVEQNHATAVHWYRQAAGQGHAGAQYNLALCYENGQGVPKDLSQAVHWYRKAAEAGHPAAQYNLALCYENGDGLVKDPAQAVYWYTQAAKQGDSHAMFNLAVLYENGVSGLSEADSVGANPVESGSMPAAGKPGSVDAGTPDYAQAAIWYRKAAETGDPEAAFYLAEFCENGLGVEQNADEALRWYLAAADQSHAEAAFRTARLLHERDDPQGWPKARYYLALHQLLEPGLRFEVRLLQEALDKKLGAGQIDQATKEAQILYHQLRP